MENNLTKNIAGKIYKMGYTTGSCAAAAAKAAAKILVFQTKIQTISIHTPAGIDLNLEVQKIQFTKQYAQCCITKDGGDDIDSTTGIEIFAKAEYSYEKGITIKAGEGIGIVTKNGLKVEKGKPAINPEPMKMIVQEVSKIQEDGIVITIFAPKGKERAKKTFNPRLGIEGGISILGTTGIVVPMSEEAWKESVFWELNTKKNCPTVCFVFGNYGELFCKQQLKIPQRKIVSISNFVGYMLESAANLHFKKILLVGHIGKLIKVAAGIFHTHSHIADGRMETLCTFAALEGANQNIVTAIYNCVTTEEAMEVIKKENLEMIYEKIAEKIKQRCEMQIHNELQVDCILFDNQNKILGKSKFADETIKLLRNEKNE